MCFSAKQMISCANYQLCSTFVLGWVEKEQIFKEGFSNYLDWVEKVQVSVQNSSSILFYCTTNDHLV